MMTGIGRMWCSRIATKCPRWTVAAPPAPWAAPPAAQHASGPHSARAGSRREAAQCFPQAPQRAPVEAGGQQAVLWSWGPAGNSRCVARGQLLAAAGAKACTCLALARATKLAIDFKSNEDFGSREPSKKRRAPHRRQADQQGNDTHPAPRPLAHSRRPVSAPRPAPRRGARSLPPHRS
jgi:hypothetical protein